MVSMTVTALSLALGYLLTVGCSLLATFAIGSVAPEFVSEGHRITNGYKRIYALVWLGCAAIGAFSAVAAASVGTVGPWVVGVGLAALLIGVMWVNTWEARQRGLAHQILLSLTTVIGVAAGGWLAAHYAKLR